MTSNHNGGYLFFAASVPPTPPHHPDYIIVLFLSVVITFVNSHRSSRAILQLTCRYFNLAAFVHSCMFLRFLWGVYDSSFPACVFQGRDFCEELNHNLKQTNRKSPERRRTCKINGRTKATFLFSSRIASCYENPPKNRTFPKFLGPQDN